MQGESFRWSCSSSVLPDDVIRSIQGRLAAKRGARAEAYACRLLRGDGWSVVGTRSGPIDVIAAKDGRVALIQVKSGTAKVTVTEAETIVKWARDFNADGEI